MEIGYHAAHTSDRAATTSRSTTKTREQALLWRKDATEGEEIEDYESCEKFVTKTALFTGVFVGVTWLCTELFCEWNDPPYGRSGFQCSSINQKPFAIVYYAENKKRLVPMDSIEKVER